ncbi:MAG: polysaccharide pyruvyl transferase family protein [Firmicutes bacterium]|nr:polysaccharide pyruvyl transferase family protein [Bacillota bacterium]
MDKSPASKPDILITNSVALNGGDAAILVSMVHAIKQSFENADITVQAKNSEACRKYYPDINFIPGLEEKEKGRGLAEKIFFRLRYPRLCLYGLIQRLTGIAPGFLASRQEKVILDSFRKSSIVVSCGGGFLNDLYPIFPRTLGFVLARIYGKKTAIFAQSVGPFTGSFSKLQAKWIIDGCSSVTVRDEKSLGIIRNELGCKNKNVSFTADSAWLLQDMPLPESFSNPVEKIKKENAGSLIVGMSVRKWDFPEIDSQSMRDELKENYRKVMKELCIHLVENHHAQIVFISTCQGRPEYFTDDSVFANELRSELPESIQKNIHVIGDAFDPRILMYIMKSFDVFAGVRMHTVVLALLAGVPCAGIGYEFKTVELFTQLGIKDYAVSLYDNPTGINQLVSNLIKNISHMKGLIVGKTSEMRLRAELNINSLKGAMKN